MYEANERAYDGMWDVWKLQNVEGSKYVTHWVKVDVLPSFKDVQKKYKVK